jgi:cytochrome c peroxidase
VSRSAGGSALLLAGVAAAAAVALAGDKPPLGVPRPLDPPTNPSTPAKVALGAKLFAEPRLSADGTVSCATCHVAALAFTDGRPRAIGISKTPVARNAPTVLNAALHQRLFWDGRAGSLEDQARQPVLNHEEMGRTNAEDAAKAIAAIPEYPPLFKDAFGDDAVTLQRIARAIASFERTLVTGDAPFDKWWAGDAKAMSESAQRGYDLFIDRAGCSQCHSIRQSYALFTDGDFHNTGAGKDAGRQDKGRAGITGRDEDTAAFRTPSLRNVALTAPYMHDGSLPTLEEVVDFYVKGGEPNAHLSTLIRKLELTKTDEADLVEFLKALTSPVLPQLEECDKLLAAGRPREAFDAFTAELARRPGDARALAGLARSAVALDDAEALTTAEAALRRRVAELSPGAAKDADDPVPELLFWVGRVNQVLSRHDDATAPTRQQDSLAALKRAHRTGRDSVESISLLARMLEEIESPGDALTCLEDTMKTRSDVMARPADAGRLRETHAGIAYRRVWRNGTNDDASKAALRAVAEELDVAVAGGGDLSDDSLLYRAYAWHQAGDVASARSAYAFAATREAIAQKALQGLRNLLAKDLATFRRDLDGLRERRPDSPPILLFSAYEFLQEDHLDDAERDLLHRREVETQPSAATHYYLAQVAVKRGDRRTATDQYAIALALEPRFPKLITEYETYVRSRELRGFDDVDALVADYRQLLEAGPDDPEFQVLARNNLGFTLREVAASYSSRGAARIHTFAEGAPQKALDVLKLTVQVYEEAVALIPDDAASLPFKKRWDYAAVLNDTGLMRHYFVETQDLARAEELYLRAFELTQGSYQDAYFYNLQFLYGFEVAGRDAKWLDLARVAKDAILKEDPSSPTGFSPDEFKRKAARADFERLSAKLGK